MAKSKSSSRTNGSGATPRTSSSRTRDGAKTTSSRRSTLARPRALPGMEDARIKALDDIAHSIAEVRQQRNDLTTEEAGYKQTALKLMRIHKKTVWTFSGVELVRVPGDEHLTVRLSKGATTANADTVNVSEGAGAES